MTVEATFLPGKSHAFHRHPNQEEVIYVLEGEVEQWVEDERRLLRAGDAVVIPAAVVHASYNVGDSPARIIAVLSPCVGEAGYEVEELADEEPWRSLRGGA
jgi:quercetin dioxygenase-like cupin family protein